MTYQVESETLRVTLDATDVAWFTESGSAREAMRRAIESIARMVARKFPLDSVIVLAADDAGIEGEEPIDAWGMP